MSDQDKKAQSQISDLPEQTKAEKDADKVKGGRMSNATESGDVTQDGSRGGDTG